MPTIRVLIAEAKTALQSQLLLESREALNEARILMGLALGNASAAWLIAHDNDPLSAAHAALFQQTLARRLAGEPVAYILGYREFFGLKLKVTPATLIPRPDTETIVEAAIAKITPDTKTHVLDMGTGTGAIALAIAHSCPQAHVIATDQSGTALAVAKENAQQLGIRNIEFRQGSWYEPIAGERFNLIASNPPYIESHDPHLQQGDLRFEPVTALVSGMDGLDDIRHIIRHAPKHLLPGGWLLLEHGYHQARAVAALMEDSGLCKISHADDLAGIQRVTLGRMPCD